MTTRNKMRLFRVRPCMKGIQPHWPPSPLLQNIHRPKMKIYTILLACWALKSSFFDNDCYEYITYVWSEQFLFAILLLVHSSLYSHSKLQTCKGFILTRRSNILSQPDCFALQHRNEMASTLHNVLESASCWSNPRASLSPTFQRRGQKRFK